MSNHGEQQASEPERLYSLGTNDIFVRQSDGLYIKDAGSFPDEQWLVKLHQAGLQIAAGVAGSLIAHVIVKAGEAIAKAPTGPGVHPPGNPRPPIRPGGGPHIAV